MKSKRKNNSSGYIIGSIALTIGMCMVMPKIIETVSEYLYSKKRRPVNLQTDNDLEFASMKNISLEGEDDGQF